MSEHSQSHLHLFARDTRLTFRVWLYEIVDEAVEEK